MWTVSILRLPEHFTCPFIDYQPNTQAAANGGLLCWPSKTWFVHDFMLFSTLAFHHGMLSVYFVQVPAHYRLFSYSLYFYFFPSYYHYPWAISLKVGLDHNPLPLSVHPLSSRRTILRNNTKRTQSRIPTTKASFPDQPRSQGRILIICHLSTLWATASFSHSLFPASIKALTSVEPILLTHNHQFQFTFPN